MEWMKEAGFSVTVCDEQGVIVWMNDRALSSFAEEGGARLLGASLFDCHPEPARSKLAAILSEKRTNVYTIEKNGVKKLIYQTPWYHDGVFAGLVELSLPLPLEMPHFIRS